MFSTFKVCWGNGPVAANPELLLHFSLSEAKPKGRKKHK